MKIIHYMSLTADGHVAQAEAHGGIPPAILADLMGLIASNGSLVVGRRTYEIFRDLGAVGSIPGTVVAVSASLPDDELGVVVARSPQDALARLDARGVTGAVIGGGPEIYSAFLAAGQLDELYLNILPGIDGAGLSIATPQPRALQLELVGSGELGDGVVQLRYRRGA